MQFVVPFDIPALDEKIAHKDKVLLLGSCFTEHIAQNLRTGGMQVSANPNGIQFNPNSMAACLRNCMEGTLPTEDQLFLHQELWRHWQFHSAYCHTDKLAALQGMQESVRAAQSFLKEAQWLLVTFGSSFQYFYRQDEGDMLPVANCHKVPGQKFDKRMLSVADMHQQWSQVMAQLKSFNPNIKIIFTVSPVRHLRDGLVANNQSKARLIELTHQLVAEHPYSAYFPAYELVVDVLRDYRFFEPDKAHPSEDAVRYVWRAFQESCIDDASIGIIKQFKALHDALAHRPRFADTEAHRIFLERNRKKMEDLKARYK
ncbi:MAG: GSCFA domain-containing protein [Edaphocola sp.]